MCLFTAFYVNSVPSEKKTEAAQHHVGNLVTTAHKEKKKKQ